MGYITFVDKQQHTGCKLKKELPPTTIIHI